MTPNENMRMEIWQQGGVTCCYCVDANHLPVYSPVVLCSEPCQILAVKSAVNSLPPRRGHLRRREYLCIRDQPHVPTPIFAFENTWGNHVRGRRNHVRGRRTRHWLLQDRMKLHYTGKYFEENQQRHQCRGVINAVACRACSEQARWNKPNCGIWTGVPN
jgi:hypothetical protein